ncbi:MAG: hypothetical protein K2Q13_08750 [Nitrosomonas sp.]|uniref:hypothetical protein n=1 Tax=Nitrosomonas sp. TaxID=42353 RepID=UPI0025D5D476|nr:hypothetical protein [Nitrosomonas sp.]MBY0475131.1 hypothetical protein [Nitrosomonas sp.]
MVSLKNYKLNSIYGGLKNEISTSNIHFIIIVGHRNQRTGNQLTLNTAKASVNSVGERLDNPIPEPIPKGSIRLRLKQNWDRPDCTQLSGF